MAREQKREIERYIERGGGGGGRLSVNKATDAANLFTHAGLLTLSNSSQPNYNTVLLTIDCSLTGKSGQFEWESGKADPNNCRLTSHTGAVWRTEPGAARKLNETEINKQTNCLIDMKLLATVSGRLVDVLSF